MAGSIEALGVAPPLKNRAILAEDAGDGKSEDRLQLSFSPVILRAAAAMGPR